MGAGFAGLSAARALAAGGKDVLVLEARSRVGGRTLNQHLPGGVISEVGGQYVGPTQDRIQALAAAVGVGTFKTYNEGENILRLDGARSPYPYPAATGISGDPRFLDAIGSIGGLDAMAARSPSRRPGRRRRRPSGTPRRSRPSSRRTSRPPAAARSSMRRRRRCSAPRRPGSRSCSRSSTPRPRATRRRPGASSASSRPAAARRSRASTAARSGSRRRSRAGSARACCAASRCGASSTTGARCGSRPTGSWSPPTRSSSRSRPCCCGASTSAPACPATAAGCWPASSRGTSSSGRPCTTAPSGATPGLSGQAVSDQGPANTTFDNTPPSGGPPGILFGFIGGAEADRAARLSRRSGAGPSWRTSSTSSAPRRRSPWSPSSSTGPTRRGRAAARSAHPTQGLLRRYGPLLRKPLGRIHWAGTETATYWNGYMDGAVRSGEEAARAILAGG